MDILTLISSDPLTGKPPHEYRCLALRHLLSGGDMARQLRFDLGSHLFFGDNLTVLPAYVADESVDLIYLDPPFNSKRSYNTIFKRVDGTPAAAQIKAFDDTGSSR